MTVLELAVATCSLPVARTAQRPTEADDPLLEQSGRVKRDKALTSVGAFQLNVKRLVIVVQCVPANYCVGMCVFV